MIYKLYILYQGSVQLCDHPQKYFKLETILASAFDWVMPLCFDLFGRTQQVSQDGKSRKVRRMMPLEAGPVWLWGGLIKKYPIFISLDDSPTKKKMSSV